MFSEGTLDVIRSFDPPGESAGQPPSESAASNVTTPPPTRCRKEKLFGTIRYRIFRPRQLHMLPAPLVVIHGGPGVPSNYLMNLVNVITDRTVIFYDQLGCGRSSRLAEKEAYSVEFSVDDLRALLNHWKLKNYHLFGHSFGGIVAFEFLKQEASPTASDGGDNNMTIDKNKGNSCLSLILSSVPTETKLVESESKRLLQDIRDVGCEGDRVAVTFSQTHECRVIPTPLALLDAYAQAGSALWRGISAVPTYKAEIPTLEGVPPQRLNTPCCNLRGQYDFATESCVEGWNRLFANAQSTVLAGCSHPGLLENEQLYGDVVLSFLEDQDL